MNDDDRLQQYFSARATEIEVPSAGLATITRRGRRRRQRRTVAKVGAVIGVLAIGGAAVAQRGDGGGQGVTSYGSSVVASPLQWTLVTPKVGIGSSVTSATTDDGTIYGLSTAPGSSAGSFEAPRHLYRSTDGTEWSAVDLPADLWAADVAAAGIASTRWAPRRPAAGPSRSAWPAPPTAARPGTTAPCRSTWLR